MNNFSCILHMRQKILKNPYKKIAGVQNEHLMLLVEIRSRVLEVEYCNL